MPSCVWCSFNSGYFTWVGKGWQIQASVAESQHYPVPDCSTKQPFVIGPMLKYIHPSLPCYRYSTVAVSISHSRHGSQLHALDLGHMVGVHYGPLWLCPQLVPWTKPLGFPSHTMAVSVITAACLVESCRQPRHGAKAARRWSKWKQTRCLRCPLSRS